MSTTAEFHSIGHACAVLQQTPRAITRAAESLGIEPAMRINGIAHYDADQLELLSDHFKDQRAKRSASK